MNNKAIVNILQFVSKKINNEIEISHFCLRWIREQEKHEEKRLNP